MVKRTRHSEEPVCIWQFQCPGHLKGSWRDMPPRVAEAVEAEYMRQCHEGATGSQGTWTPWDYTLSVSEEEVVALTFHFGLMKQYSHTHKIWRPIRRILVTDA